MMNRTCFIVLIGLLSLFSLEARAQQTLDYDTNRGFVHPGGLHTQEDFDRVKAQLAAGNEKVKEAFQILTASEYSQSNVGTWPTEIIVRGGDGENYMNAARGAAAAYQNALRWKIAGTKANADAAVRILMAWARVTKGIGGDSNFALAAGIYGYEFAQAAELMRDYEGWSREDFKEFQQWMLDVWYPANMDFLRRRNNTWENAGQWWQAPGTYWSNWGLCNLLCVASIAILCDDVFIYNQGMSFFKYDQCGTFKDPRTDVPILNDGLAEFLGNFVVTTYESDLETGAYGLLGQLNESGRDAGHSAMSLGVALDVAKVGWNQGDDLFSYMNNRMAAGIEYLAAQSLSVEGLPWVDYHYCDNRYHYIDNRSWLMTGPAMGAQMRPYWGTVIGIYEGVKGVRMPFAEQAYTNMGIDGGGQGGTSGGYDHLGFSVLMNTRDVQLAPANEVPTELTPLMEYSGALTSNLIPSMAVERTLGNISGNLIKHNELGGLVNTFTLNNKTGVPNDKTITLMPQLPEGEEDTGLWEWNTGETTRNLTIDTNRSFVYRVTYTNQYGVKSTLAFPIAVDGDCRKAKLTPSITYDGVTVNDTVVEVFYNQTCDLSVRSSMGWGTFKWSSGETTGSVTTAKIRRDRDISVDYTNHGGAVTTCTFHIKTIAYKPYITKDGTTVEDTVVVCEKGGSLTLGLNLPTSVKNVTWNTGATGKTLSLEDVQETCTYIATFTVGGQEYAVAFQVFVQGKDPAVISEGYYLICEKATGRLLTGHGEGQAVTFEEGNTLSPSADGQLWYIIPNGNKHAVINMPDNLYLNPSLNLTPSSLNVIYFYIPEKSDLVAIKAAYSTSNQKYWHVNEDGTIDNSTKALSQYPFLLIPVGISTGIEEVNSEKGKVNSEKGKVNSDIYDLSGRKLSTLNTQHSTLPKGFYIINGKKVFVK